jgi:hypothetical protein
MKRTTNRFDKGPYEKTDGISGLRHFEGEDLQYADRSQFHKDTMKEWINDQKREKFLKDQ